MNFRIEVFRLEPSGCYRVVKNKERKWFEVWKPKFALEPILPHRIKLYDWRINENT